MLAVPSWYIQLVYPIHPSFALVQTNIGVGWGGEAINLAERKMNSGMHHPLGTISVMLHATRIEHLDVHADRVDT